MERWKDIKGHEGLYQISDVGRVKRIGGGRGAKAGRILSSSNVHGYRHVDLYRKQVRDSKRVHILVAEAFIGARPSDRHEINHKNGCRSDNRVENLEWCTRSENLWHAYHILGTMKRPTAPKGERSGPAILTEKEVVEIRGLYSKGNVTYAQLSDRYGVSWSTIGYIVRGKTWRHLLDM